MRIFFLSTSRLVTRWNISCQSEKMIESGEKTHNEEIEIEIFVEKSPQGAIQKWRQPGRGVVPAS